MKVWKSPICWRVPRTSSTWRRAAASSGGETLLIILRFVCQIAIKIFLPFFSNYRRSLKGYWIKRIFLRKFSYLCDAHKFSPWDSFIFPFQHRCIFFQLSLSQTAKTLWSKHAFRHFHIFFTSFRWTFSILAKVQLVKMKSNKLQKPIMHPFNWFKISSHMVSIWPYV